MKFTYELHVSIGCVFKITSDHVSAVKQSFKNSTCNVTYPGTNTARGQKYKFSAEKNCDIPLVNWHVQRSTIAQFYWLPRSQPIREDVAGAALFDLCCEAREQSP